MDWADVHRFVRRGFNRGMAAVSVVISVPLNACAKRSLGYTMAIAIALELLPSALVLIRLLEIAYGHQFKTILPKAPDSITAT